MCLPMFYATNRNNYARMEVDDHLSWSTIPDQQLIILLLATSIFMGTHSLSPDKFTEEIHQLYNLDVAKGRKSGKVWFDAIRDMSLDGDFLNNSNSTWIGPKDIDSSATDFAKLNSPARTKLVYSVAEIKKNRTSLYTNNVP